MLPSINSRSFVWSIAVTIGVTQLGCGELESTHESVAQSPALSATNGLSSVNGLSATNGLSSVNGLSVTNGLSSVNGLSATNGLMTTAAGRTTVSYIVRCALPAGHSLVKKDQNGTSYTFAGALGLAPGWEKNASTPDDRYWVSSCLMAHINTTGQHIPIYLDGLSPVGWGRNPSYPIQEGTFLGDLFVSPPVARYCGGRGYGSNIVAGRIGDTNQQGEPYSVIVKASNGSTRCDDNCARDPSGDGYTACYPIAGRAITVWRQLTGTPAVSFETGGAGFATAGAEPATVHLSSSKALHGSNSLLMTVNATGAGNAFAQVANPAGIQPGKNMTIFVNVPTGSNWGYLAAFAQDGPAKNYRWTSAGYNADQVIPGEWNSIVVPVPSDFSAADSKVGVVIYATGAGTIQVFIDAISYHD